METGGIGAWNKKEGDLVEPGHVIASIQTDKASVDFESTDEFYIAKILYPEGTSDLKVNQVIAIATEDEDELKSLMAKDASSFLKASAPAPEKKEKKEAKKEKAPEPTTPKSQPQPQTPVQTSVTTDSEHIFISPLMKSLHKTQMEAVKALWAQGFRGTGPNGRIIERDEEALKLKLSAVSTQPSTSTTTKSQPTVDLSQDKVLSKQEFLAYKTKLVAQALQTVPHYYMNSRISVTKTLNLIDELKKSPDNKNISLNSLILSAISKASRDYAFTRHKWVKDEIHEYTSVSLTLHTNHSFRTHPQAENKNMKYWSEVNDKEVRLSETNGTLSVRLNGKGYEHCLNGESCFFNVDGVQSRLVMNGDKVETER